MLMSALIADVLPRVGRMENPSGITIFGAATSIQSLIFKQLLRRESDLLATGNLFLIIPAYDYMTALPSDFLSMAEKPRAVEASSWFTTTAWMAGTVTSYTAATKTLVLNVTSSNGSGTLAAWSLAAGVLPGDMIYTLDTSVSSVAVGTGAKTFVTVTELSIVPGQNIIVSNVALPTDSAIRSAMDPSYLDNDEHEDYQWWERYRIYGETWETAAMRPRRFKVIGTNIYFRPKVSASVMVTGKYNAKPSALTVSTATVPWNGFFDEIFREGVVRILQKGVAIPDADSDFMAFFAREFDTIINSRVRQIPVSRRLKRSNFL